VALHLWGHTKPPASEDMPPRRGDRNSPRRDNECQEVVLRAAGDSRSQRYGNSQPAEGEFGGEGPQVRLRFIMRRLRGRASASNQREPARQPPFTLRREQAGRRGILPGL